MVNSYAITKRVIVDTRFEFESLLVTSLAQGQIASWEHLVDSASSCDELL